MSISQSLLPELEMEMASARRCIERVPDAKLDYKPHEKSFSAGDLVAHLTEIPQWGKVTFESGEFDLEPEGGSTYQRAVVTTIAGALEEFDKRVASLKEMVAKTSDEAMMEPWSLKKTGKVLMTMPKIAVYRTFIMNHLIHHRGQLSVYLRMLDVPVPSIYGPSADEGNM